MMSKADKINFVNAHLAQIAEILGKSAAVLIVMAETDAETYRWPPCKDDCELPHACTRLMFEAAADYLEQRTENMTDAEARALGLASSGSSRD